MVKENGVRVALRDKHFPQLPLNNLKQILNPAIQQRHDLSRQFQRKLPRLPEPAAEWEHSKDLKNQAKAMRRFARNYFKY